ncbi:MAG: T9SS type A sorting domain-containing protein [Bacteroidota bacterium]
MNKFFTTTLCLFALVFTAEAQWEKINNPDLGSGFGVSAMLTDNTTLWAGTTGRIFKSTDGGTIWTEVSTGLQSGISGCSGIVKQGNRHYASFSGNGNYYVYYTENQGQSWSIDTVGWSNSNGALPATVQLTTFKDYVLARLESNFVMYKKNTDPQWNILPVPNEFRTPATVYAIGDTLVLGAGYIGLTTDMGLNWIKRQTTWPAGMPLGFINGIWQDLSNPAVLYGNYQVLSTSKPVLFVTKNNQMTWDSIHMNIDNPALASSIWANGQSLYVAYTGSFTGGDTLKKVFHSSNAGLVWTNITENLYSFTSFKFHSLKTMQVLNGTLFGGFSEAGVVKHAAGPTGLQPIKSSHTVSFYPNPATNLIDVDTEIETVTILDLTGKTLMETAVSGAIDISGLQAGIYILKAQQGTQTYVSRLIKQ